MCDDSLKPLEHFMKLSALIISASLLSAPAIAECSYSKTAQAEPERAYLTAYTEVKSDIVDTAAEVGSFTTLLAAAGAAGLVDALKGDGPLTVFAPTDAAFEALPEGTVETLLLPENKEMLAGILKLHVVSGKIMSSDLAGQTLTAPSLNGELAIDATDGVVITAPGSVATVVTADVEASNGVIHVIDTVLLPGS